MPLALQGPGFETGGRIQQLVSLIDLPPTLLAAAGLPIPPQMQGHSFLPLLQGEPGGWPDDVLIQISEAQLGRAIRTQRWKYGVNVPDKDGWQDAAAERYAEEFLYDLKADPYELNNLVGRESHRDVAAVLQERLIRRMVAVGEVGPIIEPAPRRPAEQYRVSAAEARM